VTLDRIKASDSAKIRKKLPVQIDQEVNCDASNVWPGIMVHQPYSKLKKHLGGLRFQTDEDVQEEVKQSLSLQDASFYHQSFDSLIYRYDNCFNRYGDYIEK
jgi:hypothetical protein